MSYKFITGWANDNDKEKIRVERTNDLTLIVRRMPKTASVGVKLK
jgi:hypothetical protein